VADGLAARGTYDQQIQALERNTFAEQRRLDLSICVIQTASTAI
jgi:hypothetical protein